MRDSLTVFALLVVAGGAACTASHGGTARPEAGIPVADAGVDASCTTASSCDPHNCGAPGHDCLGAACSMGMCAPLQLTTVNVTALALDDTNAYFTNDSDYNDSTGVTTASGVRGVPKSGGQPFDIALPPPPDGGVTRASANLVLSGNTLYWTSYFDAQQGSSTGTLDSAPVSAQNAVPQVLAPDPSGVAAIGVVGQTLYGFDGCGGIASLPVTGGSWTPITAPSCPLGTFDLSGAITFDAPDGYFFGLRESPTTGSSDTVTRTKVADGSTIDFGVPGLPPVADGGAYSGTCAGIAVSGGTVYMIVNPLAGSTFLYASALDGTNVREIAHAAGSGSSSGPIVISGGALYAYWNGPISRIDLATGDVLPLLVAPCYDVSASFRPEAIFVVDDEYLYIGCGPGTLPRPDSQNGIFRLAK